MAYMKDALHLAYHDATLSIFDLHNLTFEEVLKIYQIAEENRRNLEFEDAERFLAAEGEWPVGCEY
jgi:hypothetical protein